MSNKQEPTRRDYHTAKGYLDDLFADASVAPESMARVLMDAAHEVKVQRHNDLLVLKFDLNNQDKLPEATDDDPDNLRRHLVADEGTA